MNQNENEHEEKLVEKGYEIRKSLSDFSINHIRGRCTTLGWLNIVWNFHFDNFPISQSNFVTYYF